MEGVMEQVSVTDDIMAALADGEWHEFAIHQTAEAGYTEAHFLQLKRAGHVNLNISGRVAKAIATERGLSLVAEIERRRYGSLPPPKDSASKGVPTMPAAVSVVRPTIRTSMGLRDALFDEIDAFRRGVGNPQRALAISKLASQILASAKLEQDAARKKDGQAAKPLVLGSPSEDDDAG